PRLQAEVNCQIVSHAKCDALYLGIEARSHYLDLVIAGLKIAHLILADIVRLRYTVASSLWLMHLNGGVRDDRARSISNASTNCARRSLGEDTAFEQDKYCKNNQVG